MAVARVSFPSVLAVVGALACAAALPPATARAGTYEVVACDAAPGGAAGSWVGSATPRMAAASLCPTRSAPERGMAATAKVDVGPAAPFATATQAFDAPPAATIVSLKAQLALHRKQGHWGVGVYADGQLVLGCAPNDGNLCSYPAAWPGTTRTLTFPGGVRRVAAQTICRDGGGCPTGPPTSAPLYERAGIRVFAATVRVSDDTAPSVSDTHQGALTSGAWQRGSRYVGYAASDNVGIRTTRFYVDGRQRDDLQPACDFSRRVPCPNLPSARYLLDTQAIADGPHALRVQAVDTAGNTAALVESFNTDNTAPNAPDGVTVDGGEDWRAWNAFRLRWRNTASAAPIAVAHYELCPAIGGACVRGERRGAGIDSIADLAVPAPGDYTARVWLEDAAGNVNDGNRSAPVHLRFDDVAPGLAAPVGLARWTNSTELDVPIEMGIGQLVPASGVAGYSVTIDGTDPDATIDSHGALYHVGNVPEGVTTLRARAISGAGIASPYVGETQIQVDRTRPTVTAAGAPAGGDWRREPVTVQLRGADQPGLAGIAPAPPGEPLESGGYLEYRIDGADPQRVRGDAADVTLADDGEHAVVVKAVDAAGNESDDAVAHVRIDRTPPEVVVFEPVDPGDPRAVRVAVGDRLSGIADGVVELRRAGGDSAWRALATNRQGAQLVATIDDDVLAGVYELRARVTDRAGNEGVGDRRRDGSPAIVDVAALRGETRLTAGVPNGKGGLLTATTIPFGAPAVVHGTLARATGAPIAGATVEIWSRPAIPGSAFALRARARTSATGAFGSSLAPGPSRIVRVRYPGSPVERPSQADVTVRVPAAATIRASRSAVRNGQSVTFTGRLLGRPIPRGGKVLDLQAYYRGGWRTFATPRAGTDGAWSYTYRFGATRGRLVYRFRVVVRPESAYPYALGYSPTTTVTVTG